MISKAGDVSLDLFTRHVTETSNIQLKMIIFSHYWGIFFRVISRRIFSKSTPSNSAFKKASIALFFMILGKHSGSGQRFWGKISQKGISQKLAHKDLFIGSLRYCFHALKCIPGIWLTSRNGLVKLLSLFVRDCTQTNNRNSVAFRSCAFRGTFRSQFRNAQIPPE